MHNNELWDPKIGSVFCVKRFQFTGVFKMDGKIRDRTTWSVFPGFRFRGIALYNDFQTLKQFSFSAFPRYCSFNLKTSRCSEKL